ncbi:DUF3160 domain-containing protein [Bacteroides sp. BFG-551]|nr:DUF3160 domain-containing protein [Bacteroides sp. BFG-551]
MGIQEPEYSSASWAELKHDAILYGEQPMAAECGGAGPPDPIVVGYVEPNLPFGRKCQGFCKPPNWFCNKAIA